jgi:hypothetical protein
MGKSGVTGEESKRLLMYLIFTSRKRENPLHIISLGSSGAGKSHLQEKVAELIPDEDKIESTSLTSNVGRSGGRAVCPSGTDQQKAYYQISAAQRQQGRYPNRHV